MGGSTGYKGSPVAAIRFPHFSTGNPTEEKILQTDLLRCSPLHWILTKRHVGNWASKSKIKLANF